MLSETIIVVILVCSLHMFTVNCYSGNALVSKKNVTERHKRTLNFYFEYNSCYALAAVISLPLDNTPAGRQVFCSYNFETNYYYAYFSQSEGLVPLPFTTILEPGSNAGTKHRISLPPAYRQFNGEEKEVEVNDEKSETKDAPPVDDNLKAQNETKQLDEEINDGPVKRKSKTDANKLNEKIGNRPTKQRKDKVKKTKNSKNKSRNVRSLFDNYFMSRRRFYKFLESQMDRAGLHGNDCTLRAICETSHSKFGFHNGVVGSVVDVLFLPSASKDEKLPKRYYQAEEDGKTSDCSLYVKKCPKGLFDSVSIVI